MIRVKPARISGLIYATLIICAFIFGEMGVVLAEGITGSVHDFSSQGWSGGEICKVCHTPHNADTTVTPLWNHELSSATYTLYSSPTLDGPIHPPGRPSKLCLSCHDGTVAIDSFNGTAGGSFISGNALIGTDLSDDHPVGVEWSHQTLEGGSSASCARCHNMHDSSFKMPLPFYEEGGTPRVECSTCHDPHDDVPSTNGKLLRKPLAGSEICLHCHDK